MCGTHFPPCAEYRRHQLIINWRVYKHNLPTISTRKMCQQNPSRHLRKQSDVRYAKIQQVRGEWKNTGYYYYYYCLSSIWIHVLNEWMDKNTKIERKRKSTREREDTLKHITFRDIFFWFRYFVLCRSEHSAICIVSVYTVLRTNMHHKLHATLSALSSFTCAMCFSLHPRELSHGSIWTVAMEARTDSSTAA